MSRAYRRQIMPQRIKHECSDCDGAGVTQAEDFDEHGRHLVNVTCEGCFGLGHLVDCDVCDKTTPVPELEMHGGRCARCVAELEMVDASSERARIRRIA